MAQTNSNPVTMGLANVLANSYALLIKTHNYHWNIRGPGFHGMHVMLEDQYNDLFTGIDEVAERIRALGEFAPGGLAVFQSMAKVKDAPDNPPDYKTMIQDLVKEQHTLIKEIHATFEKADEAGDDGSADLMTKRRQAHEKNAWMLQATLGESGPA